MLVHPGGGNRAPGFSGHVGLNLGDWFAVTTHVQAVRQVDFTGSSTSVAWFAGGRLGSYPGAVTGVAAPLAVLITFLIACGDGRCFH